MAQIFNVNALPRQKVYKIRKSTPTDDILYKNLFRFNRLNVEWLCNYFFEEYFETRGGAINNQTKMELTLRYLAEPRFQISVGHEFGVAQSTASKTILSTLDKIVSKSSDWIIFPTSEPDRLAAKQSWRATLGLPGCISAIDCTHVKIQKPAGVFGDEFINRKGFASINVQATCNEKYVFTSVDCSWPGSVHDNRIWTNSNIYQFHLNRPNNHSYLIGDEGYAISPFLIKPFRNPIERRDKLFNKLFCKNRVVIEQSFGQLKRRFPILKYGIRLKLESVPKCIGACFVLHNIAKHLHDDDFNNDDPEDDDYDLQFYDGGGGLKAQGEQRREEIKDVLFG